MTKRKMTKNLFITSLVFFAILILFPAPEAQAAANARDVFFYEIMWSGSDASTADEWFVLKNNTDKDIELDGWRVTYLKGDDDKEEPMVSLKGKILAGGYFLVSNFKAEDKESAFRIAPDMSSPDHNTVSLRNEYLEIRLYDSAPAIDTTPIDVAGDRSVRKPFGGSNGDKSKNLPKASMVRVNTSIDGGLKEAWGTTEVQCNIKYSYSELATPQSKDPDTKCHPPSVQLLNNWPKSLKLGESFTAQLKISDEVDTSVSGSINGTNEQWPVGVVVSQELKCDTVGEKEIKITATDSKGSTGYLIDKTTNKSFALKCYDSGAVVINEVLPAPKTSDYDQSGGVDSKDEWIELHNTESRPIDLTGWTLGDNSKPQRYEFDANTIIEPNGFLTITNRQSKIALNNDGDEVYLYDPSGLLVDKLVYDKSHDDAGWARFDTGLEWTATPTFNSANIRSPILSAADTSASPPVDGPDPPKTETVVYKVTKTKTVHRPDFQSLYETPDLSQFVQKLAEMARQREDVRQRFAVEQLIIGLGGLLSLARVGYNLVYLLL